MKRGYEWESILSQSLARQDKPVQQMNSNENGKTYSRKMLPKGTTSTIPSTSTFPTSSTPANEDRTRADKQVASDDTPISTFDKDGVEGTVSPSLANTRSKTSDVIETPDCLMKFENLEDFFARVRGKIKRAQSLDFSTDQSSPIDDKISSTQKSTPLAEMLATTKAPDLSAERALALEKLKENLPHFSLTLRRAKKDKVEYYKKAAKKSLLIDELIKNQELYTDLKDCSDKLEIQISKLEARVKDAKTKIEAIQEQKLTLARMCFQKSSLDELEVEFHSLKEMKEVADSDVARVEESLIDFKSKIIE